MEKLKGFARNVYYVNSDIDASQGASASRIGIFELEGQPIYLKIHDGIFIEQGDQVIVAGASSSKRLHITESGHSPSNRSWGSRNFRDALVLPRPNRYKRYACLLSYRPACRGQLRRMQKC